jgi:hypothetical protein
MKNSESLAPDEPAASKDAIVQRQGTEGGSTPFSGVEHGIRSDRFDL